MTAPTSQTSHSISGSGDSPLRVVRVFERPESARPPSGTMKDVAAWLQGPAGAIEESAEMFDELCWRMRAAGMPIGRVMLSVRTLHPQFLGFGFRWRRRAGVTEETVVVHGVRESDFYLASPLRPVFEERRTVRARLEGGALANFPVLAELKAEGFTDYLATPIVFSEGRVHGMTLAADQPGGFSDDHIAALEKLAPSLANLLELHALRRMMSNLLDVYLGRLAGHKVLKGEIHRGRGEAIGAIIWSSDLRGFTSMSDRVPGERVVEILNAAFEAQAAPIHAAGGEILKFIGDGLLAIFPLVDVDLSHEAASRALDAARQALANVDALNVRGIGGEASQIKIGVALHPGEIYFGNIGAPDRLDFTAIGPAVNLVSRLEQLSKRLDRRLLLSDAFARLHSAGLVSLGVHPLRGMSEPIEVFTIA